MRNCPSCNSPCSTEFISEYNAASVVKSGGKAPDLSLYGCDECGMIYVDESFSSHVDQLWFDHYYQTYYQTDDKPFSAPRLDSLAACINGYDLCQVLDIGGMDRELAKRINLLGGFCAVSGIGIEDIPGNDAVILSHTLEHIYDVPAMMRRVKTALIPAGLLFVEVPVWLDYLDLSYDNHWQHINKFRPSDLENILKSHGFDVVLSQQIDDYREYHVWRVIGRMK